ncbi:hypothetical protein FEM08_20890 [Flavobacterium gilvum]|nr:hypothetical protein FEM08_20890 [Flavobacterium gilvum]
MFFIDINFFIKSNEIDDGLHGWNGFLTDTIDLQKNPYNPLQKTTLNYS